jgi:hypothetical protein
MTRPARWPRRLACTLVAALAVAALPTAAQAATYVLRPSKTVSGMFGSGWTSTPQTSTPDSVLAKAIIQPTAPSASSFVTATNPPSGDGDGDGGGGGGGGGGYDVLGVQAAAPPSFGPGESVTSATAWVYLNTGTSQSVSVYLAIGYQPLASATIPAGKPAGWYSVSTNKALASTDLSQLTIWLTSQGPSGATNANAYAAYVQLDTNAPAHAGTGGQPTTSPTQTPSTAPGLSGSGPSPISGSHAVWVDTPNVIVSASQKDVPVDLSCAVATPGGCHGVLELRVLSGTPVAHGSAAGGPLAVTARCARGCRLLGRQSFNIAAGHTKRVKVHLAHSAGHLLHGHKSVTAQAVVITHDATNGAQTVKTSVTLTQARPSAKPQGPGSPSHRRRPTQSPGSGVPGSPHTNVVDVSTPTHGNPVGPTVGSIVPRR